MIQPGKHGKLTRQWKNNHLKLNLLLKMVNVPLLCQFFWGYPFFQPKRSASPHALWQSKFHITIFSGTGTTSKIKLQHLCANKIFQVGSLELSRKTLNTTTQELLHHKWCINLLVLLSEGLVTETSHSNTS